jgi:hypothetical protein
MTDDPARETPGGPDPIAPRAERPPAAAAVAARFEGSGYEPTWPADRGEPDCLLRPAERTEPPLARVGTGVAVVVEALHSADPTVVVDAVAAAAREGRFTLLAADRRTAVDARAVLTDPPAVRAVDGDGHRTFYGVPDRVRVGDAGFGAVRADADPVWRESSGEGVTGDDRTRLLLEADDRVHAAFDGYTTLACPAPGAFPYTYRRETDKRVHVRNRDGREVGVYDSFRAMKADAYRPVPDPLVPEVHLPRDVRLSRAWALAVVEDGAVVEFLTA